MSKGLKRICMNCGARFYDLNKNPIICPACDTEFTGEIKVKTRKGKTAEAEPTKEAAKKEPDDEIDEIDADDDIVSLDDVDEGDDADEDEDTISTIDDDPDDLDDIDDNLDDDDDDENDK